MSQLNFSNLTSEYINDFLESYLKSSKEFNDNLTVLSNTNLSWNSYIQKELDFDAGWADKLTVFEMSSFHSDEVVRNACHECETKLSEFGIEQSMRRDLFAKFKHYYYNQFQTEKQSMTGERVRYIEEAMKSYRMNGLELDDEKYERVKELKKQISTHSINFSQNLNNYNKEFILTKEQLTEMTDSWLSARETLDSMYRISLKYPDYVPVMERCSNRETRKIMSEEFNKRCYDENKPIIECIFKLRNDLAREFGFELYSDYKLQNRMAKNTQNVMEFLSDIKIKIKPVLESDYKKLLNIARLDGINTFDDLKPYDLTYYSRIYTEKESELDMEKVKQYFPLDQIIKGTFDIYETILGLKFINVSVEHSASFWHPDVMLYKAINTEDNSTQGEFYLDLHPRTGKYGHAAVFPIKRGNLKAHPICIMACNFPKDDNLSFDDIVTFFHEFGHVMHGITSRPELSSMSGTSVSRDAVECPSQMLEEWCYRAPSLKVLAPDLLDDVIEKLIKQKNMLQGYFNARQLGLCFIDIIQKSILNCIKQINKYSYILFILFKDFYITCWFLRTSQGYSFWIK